MEREPIRKRQLSVSLPAQRWRNGFLSIKEEINLQASFFRQPESNFRRIFIVRFENMFRRVVREELEMYFSNLPPRPPPNQNGQARYKLIIKNHIKSPIFTTDIFEPIQIEIYDTYNQSIVSHSKNPLSLAKVKIVTLNAEKWKNQKENWSQDEFKQSILIEREGKGSILTGDIQFRLENGVKIITNLVARDNSKWTKNGFMLGVMIENEEGFRVLEGLSNPFKVKDRRGKACQKPDVLQLTHNVRSLSKIGKDRALILENYNIKTVHDFLICYHNNQAKLRQILGIKSESDKDWRSIVKHAMECKTEFDNALNCMNNLSEEFSMDKHEIISSPHSRQIHFEDHNKNNFDQSRISPEFSLSTIEEVMNWLQTDCCEEFGTAQLQVPNNNMLVRNVPLFGSNGPHFVGSSSSEPDPFDHNINNQDQSSLFTSGFGEIAVEQSEIPFNGEPNDHMESIETIFPHESTDPFLFRKDSFDPDQCEQLIQNFKTSMWNNFNNFANKGPFSPRKKAKIRAIIKWVTWPAVQRKKARIEEPVLLTEVRAV